MIETSATTSWARRLKVRHLESFLVLDDAGTLTQAAQRLHMTQSAMSHWLAEMESIVGAPLLVRGRKLQLTPTGKLVKKLAISVLGEIARAGVEIHAVSKGQLPRLNIGSVWAGIAGGLPQAIHRFQNDRPHVNVAVHDGPFDTLLKGLQTRAMDAVIGVLDARAYLPGVAHQVLFEDKVSVVIGKGSRFWNCGEALTLDALSAEKWVMPPTGTLTRMQLDAFLIEQEVSWLQPRAETASLITMLALLQRGDYVGVCSDSMASFLCEQGLMQKVLTPSGIHFGPVTVMWKREHESQTLQDFVGYLTQAAQAQHLQTTP